MILNSTMGVGGAERILASLVRGLRGRGYEPVVCCLYEPGEVGEELAREGVEVVSGVMRSRRDAAGVLRLSRMLRRRRIDVLYMNNQPATQLWGTLAATLARTRLVVTALHFTARDSGKNRRLNRFTARGVDLWITISHVQKRRLVEREGVPSGGAVTVVPNGVDVERFARGATARAATRAALGIPGDAPVAGIVAGLRAEKNHSVFLKAARRVLDRRPDARFLVVGDGDRRQALEREAGDLGVDGATSFLGIRHDTPELIGACDVGVLSSSFGVETSPVTLLEFMSAGKPVVSTDVGAVREIVVEGVNGFVVPEDDDEALAAALLRVIEDEALAAKMGDAGRAHVTERFSLDRMVTRTEEELMRAWERVR